MSGPNQGRRPRIPSLSQRSCHSCRLSAAHGEQPGSWRNGRPSAFRRPPRGHASCCRSRRQSGKGACSSGGKSARLISVRSVVRVYPGPPSQRRRQAVVCGVCGDRDATLVANVRRRRLAARPRASARVSESPSGAVAQSGERLLCTQEVVGSTPIGSTITVWRSRRRVIWEVPL